MKYLLCPNCHHPLSIQRAVPRIEWAADMSGLLIGKDVHEPTYLVCEYVAEGLFEDLPQWAQEWARSIEMTGRLIDSVTVSGRPVKGNVCRVGCGWSAQLIELTTTGGDIKALISIQGFESILHSA